LSEHAPLDRRVQRSRSLLKEALTSLIEQRDLADITIRDITDRANLGRATFYLHYDSKEDLLAEVLDDLFAELRATMTGTGAEVMGALADDTVRPEVRRPLGSRTLELLDSRRELYRSLANSSAALEFWDRIQDLYEDGFLKLLKRTGKVPAPGSPSFEYRALYAAGGARAIVRRWLERDDAQPAEVGSYWTRYITVFLLTENVVDPEPTDEQS